MPSAFPKQQITWLIAKRDNGWFCRYCNYALMPMGAEDMCATTYWMERPTIDHLLPKSRGGTDALENLGLACNTCNARKGAKTPEEYADWIIATAPARRLAAEREQRAVERIERRLAKYR